METKLQQEINNVLKVFPEYWHEDTLLKNKLIEDIRSYNEKLIEALLSNALIRDTYSFQLQSGTIFKVEDFISMLRFKNYWDNSYTKYTNEVGLTSEGKYLKYNTDVVLDFPHKDSVLEGGMTKEDRRKKEIYYHNVIAKEEIDTLLSPKVLTKAKKYDEYGEHEVNTLHEKDNLILKGNNLITLHSLRERYLGKVKLIYIDPPYNTGGDSFKYNDRFNHSTWLTFMKNRLEVAKDLLADDGIIWVQSNDIELNYLGVLLDSIFGRYNSINTITVKTKIGGVSGSSEGKSLRDATEFLQIYAKNKNNIKLNSVYETTPVLEYVKEYKESGKSWKYTQVLVDLGEKKEVKRDSNYVYYHYPEAITSSVKRFAKDNNITEDEVYTLHPEKIFRTTNAQSSIRKKVINELNDISSGIVSIEYKPVKGKNKDQLTEVFYNGSNKDMFMYLKDMLDEVDGELHYKRKLSTLWENIQYNNLKKEGNIDFQNGKKPEKLLFNIISLSTEKNDIVLDFFMGSGSTLSAALKLNRRFIGIEQLDYINTITLPRLKNVIKGEQNGISKEVNWDGGGSFVYAELYSLNKVFIDEIQACSNHYELEVIFEKMKKSAYLNFKVDLNKVTTQDEKFKSLSLEEQKDVLIQVLDMNQLYLNYSEIEDSQYDISDSVKAFNHSFYQKEGGKNE